MSTEHSKRAAKFTQNVEKTTWHDATFWSVRQKRDRMAQGLPEWEDLREHASEIKMHTITHLADYLDMFSKNLESRGVKVHWAKDAQEFNEIVLGILKDHNVKKMVKSKSMLTEECEMNPYLEQHGIDVVETDLGERIIQLLGQKPSHIVMPAIHLKREEVGKMFEEKGISKEIGNYDPTYLTRCARHHLRDQFMEAGAGMTGCNFGVAATGDCVVCTNEGNADMTTSMPKLHIVAMGIEKLVPDYKSLAVFQRLLCRCGTGQPTTAFTSHFRQARPGAEMHVVLVDNGRSDILADKDHWQTLKCMRCGACMNTCPVYRRSGGYSYTYFYTGSYWCEPGYAEESSEVQRQCFCLHLVLVLRQCLSFQGRTRFADLRMAPESGEVGQGRSCEEGDVEWYEVSLRPSCTLHHSPEVCSACQSGS